MRRTRSSTDPRSRNASSRLPRAVNPCAGRLGAESSGFVEERTTCRRWSMNEQAVEIESPARILSRSTPGVRPRWLRMLRANVLAFEPPLAAHFVGRLIISSTGALNHLSMLRLTSPNAKQKQNVREPASAQSSISEDWF